MSSNVVINVNNISKCYHVYDSPIDRLLSKWWPEKKKEFWAIKNLSFEVGKGETVAIIGKNGSGKSTLLQMICGTLQQTSGNLNVKGRIAALLELGAGFDLESTGRENVYINAMLLGMTKREIEQKFKAIEAFADIGEFIDRPVKTYSSGMYVRLAFSVIANSEPDVLIIDEALAVGDVFFVQKCMRFIREYKEKGTILFVSHDTSAVTSLCDRAIWIDNGELKRSGNAKAVTEEYLAFQHARDRYLEVGDSLNIDTLSINEKEEVNIDYSDCRDELINASILRNDIKIVDLTYSNNYGLGHGEIIDVGIYKNNEKVLTFIGGEIVSLIIKFKAIESLDSVISGFYFKDRLGQKLFGDNTYISYINSPFNADKGSIAKAEFKFRMPTLPVGDYSVDVALATGNQDNHTQQHWIHDVISFRSISSGVATGLVGIPMISIKLAEVDDGF
ncbi:MAG: ABC transporter ATP-binding protein [Shewanella sp.]